MTCSVNPEIRVLTEDGTVVRLPVETYLKHVVPAEMPALWPPQALRAMAIASRTYSYYAILHPRHDDQNADICTTTHCHVYNPDREHEQTNLAIKATSGLVIVYDGKIITAVYHADCGGQTLDNESVWIKGEPRPYLRGVSCPVIRPCGQRHGHGVGLCQAGTREMARQGKHYAQIIKHYYTDSQIQNIAKLEHLC